MTPKEMAIHLVKNVFDYSWTGFPYIVSIKCVEQIINSHINEDGSISNLEKHSYWMEVKYIIENTK